MRFLIILLFPIFIFAANYRTAENGFIDLSQYNFDSNKAVKLDGYWEFYYNKFLFPDDFKELQKPDILLKVPGVWNDFVINGEKISAKGFGTYRLIIKKNNKYKKLGLKIGTIGTSYRLFVDGVKVTEVGNPSANPNDCIPAYRPQPVIFDAQNETIELIFHVSNFVEKSAGIWDTLYIGTPESLERLKFTDIHRNIFILGSIIFMALYHLALFIVRKKEKAALWFSIYAFLIGLRIITTGERHILYFFPTINWELLEKFEFLSYYAATIFIVLFIRTIFSEEFNEKIFKIFLAFTILFSALVFFFPLKIYIHTLWLFQIFTIILSCYALFTAFKAYLKKRTGALLFLIGFFIFIASVLNDIMVSNQFYSGFYLVHTGFFVFLFFQALILAARFSKAFKKSEKLAGELCIKSKELEKINNALTNQIEIRVNAEKELRNTKDYLDNLVNSLSSFIITINTEKKTVHLNRAALKFFGINAKYSENIDIFSIAEFFKRYKKEIDLSLTNNAQYEFNREKVEFRGFEYYFKVSIFPFVSSDKNGVVIKLDDITELERKDEQLRQAQKMETVGNLAGGLAHDFKNVLGGITGTLSLMKMALNENEMSKLQFLEDIETIEKSVENASDTVKRLLTISRKEELNLQPLDLNKAVSDTLKICKNSLPKNIEVVMQLFEEPAMVLADKSQIEQVFLNLAINASHSMTIMRKPEEIQGGRLIVSVNPFIGTAEFFEKYEVPEESYYWKISFKDTGVGIDKSVINRIFEPFFSTKERGVGTGLGLSMVYSIIKSHNGTITVESIPGRGTTFSIYLQAIKGES